jgi:hypothetical protein
MTAIGPTGEGPEPEVTNPPPAQPDPDSPTQDAATPAGGWSSPGIGPGDTPPGRRPKAIVIGAIVLLGAVLVAVVAKVLPFFAVGVLGSALAGAFGGPWERLPGDVQKGYQERVEAAVGDRLDGLGYAERAARMESLIRSGLPRLSDDRLVERLLLQTGALLVADESICAAFGRQSIGGQVVDEETSTALLSNLPTDDLITWVGISVEAIEAETQGFPDPVLASEEEASALIDSVLASMPEAEVQTIADVSQGATATDTRVCGAIRSLYDVVLNLDSTSRAVMARIDIQPQP